jgi:hypothetical protein
MKRLLRVRLSARWRLLGKVWMGSVVVMVAVFVAAAAHAIWALPAWLLVVIMAGVLHLRAQRTLRLGLGLIDLTAQETGLTKLP